MYLAATTDPGNPFAAWNTIWLKYCDGSIHTGQRTNATADTFGLYFSGHNSIHAMITSLVASTSLGAAGTFVAFAGGSAGGFRIFKL